MNEFESGKFSYYEKSHLFHASLKNIMGTRFDIVIVGKDKIQSESVWYTIESELKRLNNLLNRFDKLSETSRINSKAASVSVIVTDEMWHILNSCKYYHQHTLGLFDITLKDFDSVKFSEYDKSITFAHPGIQIDFGGYGKGYALNKIKSILVESKIDCSYVDFGNSSILGLGHHPYGDDWKVTIENPYNKDQIIDELSLRDTALSISGNTPTYSGHIVAPKSGQSISEPRMVSVISDNPLEAEVLSTALMIANEQEKKQIKENFNILNIKEYKL